MTGEKAGELLSENMSTLYLWSLSKMKDTYLAEELCQDVVCAVLGSIDKLRSDDAFFGFLWQVASNTYKLNMRKAKKHDHSEFDETVADTSDFTEELLENEEFNRLRRELSILSGEYRKCTVAYYYDNMSCKEISKKYDISLDMVKYYLFKSRKILKEGIAMERQFGEKSFKPAEFYLETIYCGNENNLYKQLFTRKLPGQIILSSFYQPMTVEQLSVELGVASVYLEEELEMLMQYGFVVKENKKYVTNIVIITKAFEEALYNKCSKELNKELTEILESLKSKLSQIRDVGFTGCDIDEMSLLWDMYAYITMKATWHNDKGMGKWKTLHDTTTGVHFGYDYDCQNSDPHYNYVTYAGQCFLDNGLKMTYICWKALKCYVNYNKISNESYVKEVFGKAFPIFKKEDFRRLDEILADVQISMNKVVERMSKLSLELLIEFSPSHLVEKVKELYPCFNVWSTIGWYGGAALDTGILKEPDENALVGIYGYNY